MFIYWPGEERRGGSCTIDSDSESGKFVRKKEVAKDGLRQIKVKEERNKKRNNESGGKTTTLASRSRRGEEGR